MDTYGDMVTLLLCFFVLLYSMSTISEENWKAIVQSFNPSAVETPTVTTGAGGPDADHDSMGGEMPDEVVATPTQAQVDADIEELFQAIQEFVQSTSAASSINVTKDGGKVYITFGQAVFFDGESSYLRKEAEPILDEICVLLSDVSRSIEEVRVLGHTAQAGSEPNGTVRDRTLSAARAAMVVAYVQDHSSMDPARLISEGLGQWRPVDTNDTAEGKARNRRVEMVVSGRDVEKELQEGIPSYFTTTAATAESPSYTTTNE